MPEFQPFVMERFMSRFEQAADYNLSESGVHPVTLQELIQGDPAHIDDLLKTGLNYPHVNGIPELRRRGRFSDIRIFLPAPAPEHDQPCRDQAGEEQRQRARDGNGGRPDPGARL